MRAISGIQASGSGGRCGLLALSMFLISALLSPFSARADSNANAIVNMAGMPFNGANVNVGQMELGIPTNTVVDFNSANFVGETNYTSGSGLDNHATEVASVIISTGAVTRGTAPGAKLYSVGANTIPDDISGMWLLATQQNVQVINESAGTSTVTGFVNRVSGTNFVTSVRVSNANGQDQESRAEDNLVQTKGVTFVLAAGNDGRLGTNSIDLEASAYNIITVGAVSNTTAGTTGLANFSSQGFLANGRAGIDLVAPGADLIMNAFNTNGTFTAGVTVIYSNNAGQVSSIIQQGTVLNGRGSPGAPQSPLSRVNTNSGTSFAAPMVAGVAADLISAAKSGTGVFTSSVVSADAQNPRIIKAVLMNSATKLPGWTQNSITNGGPNGSIQVMQSLDPNQGAGLMNAGGSYQQLAAGEQGMTVRGGTMVTNSQVNLTGWALEGVNLSLTNLYQFNQKVGGTLSATLDWYRLTAATTFADQGLDNLDLILLSSTNSTFTNPKVYAETISNTVDNVQQLYFTNLPTAYYELGVYFASTNNSTAGLTSDNYGLAWNATVPEPSALLLAGLGITALSWRLKRRRTSRSI